jgi:hypothetical protein
MDSTITSERRESGNHYISLGLFNDNFGNSYKFFFPFSITNRPDNNQIGYCLDFLNTFIEEDGSYYNIEGFDYNIYTALYDNLHEPSNKELIEKKFREFGIIDSNGHCTYQIKNKNVMVELFIKNFNNNALDILNFSKSEYNEADNISESVLEGLLFDSETFYKEQTLEEDSENSEDEDSETLPTLENNDSNEDRELNIHLNIPELNKKIFKQEMIKDTFEYGHLSQKYTVPIQPLNFINSINLKFDETSYKLELNMGTVTYINANANLAKFKDAISRVNESFLSLIDTHLPLVKI